MRDLLTLRAVWSAAMTSRRPAVLKEAIANIEAQISPVDKSHAQAFRRVYEAIESRDAKGALDGLLWGVEKAMDPLDVDFLLHEIRQAKLLGSRTPVHLHILAAAAKAHYVSYPDQPVDKNMRRYDYIHDVYGSRGRGQRTLVVRQPNWTFAPKGGDQPLSGRLDAARKIAMSL